MQRPNNPHAAAASVTSAFRFCWNRLERAALTAEVLDWHGKSQYLTLFAAILVTALDWQRLSIVYTLQEHWKWDGPHREELTYPYYIGDLALSKQANRAGLARL